MPLFPSEVFLLWQDTVRTGNWQKLLKKRLTKPRWIAIMMLQAFHGYSAGRGAVSSAEAQEDRVKRALAAGWGA